MKFTEISEFTYVVKCNIHFRIPMYLFTWKFTSTSHAIGRQRMENFPNHFSTPTKPKLYSCQDVLPYLRKTSRIFALHFLGNDLNRDNVITGCIENYSISNKRICIFTYLWQFKCNKQNFLSGNVSAWWSLSTVITYACMSTYVRVQTCVWNWKEKDSGQTFLAVII